MNYIRQLQLSTVEALKEIYSENKESVIYMKNFGTCLEKAIASMILEAAGVEEDD